MFGSSCLADCITAGPGCAVCKATYAQTGNLIIVIKPCLSSGVCLSSLLYFIFRMRNQFYS